MASRLAYFLIAGGAVLGGMIIQDGDRMFGWTEEARVAVDTERAIEAQVERAIDQSIDREADRMVIRAEDGEVVETDAATKRALAAAVAELVRAEGSLITIKLDDNIPASVVAQAEQRRDAARQAVERLADDAKAETRGNRDALRQNIRDEIREEVRDAVRG